MFAFKSVKTNCDIALRTDISNVLSWPALVHIYCWQWFEEYYKAYLKKKKVKLISSKDIAFKKSLTNKQGVCQPELEFTPF